MMTVAPFGGTARTASPRSALRVQECCTSCRRPVTLCGQSDCQSGGKYWGTMLRGVWLEAEAPTAAQSSSAIHASVPAETGSRLSL